MNNPVSVVVNTSESCIIGVVVGIMLATPPIIKSISLWLRNCVSQKIACSSPALDVFRLFLPVRVGCW